MTISQIKYFITVAECLSFTKASEQLFVSQPALSRQIKNLEEELNIQLFVRTTNGIRLTPAGSSLYMGMAETYQRFLEHIEKAEKIQQGLSGTLKIGILDQVNVADFMPKIVWFFKEKYPNVDISFTDGSFHYLMTEMYAGRLDIIFTIQFEVVNKESIIWQYVTHSDDYLVLSKYHPLAEKENLSIPDVKDETFVMISAEDNPESSVLIYDLCKEHGFVPPVHFAKTLAEQILWIEVGMGVSILDTRSSIMLNPHVKAYKLESDWDPSLVAAWNQHNYNPLIEVFLKKMNEILQIEDEDIHGMSIEER